jgi:hypothetical protein
MPSHEIIDNRTVKLADSVNRILGTSESARFAVGYLFLSGLEAIGARISGLKELRLLIGNTTNRETLDRLGPKAGLFTLIASAPPKGSHKLRYTPRARFLRYRARLCASALMHHYPQSLASMKVIIAAFPGVKLFPSPAYRNFANNLLHNRRLWSLIRACLLP